MNNYQVNILSLLILSFFCCSCGDDESPNEESEHDEEMKTKGEIIEKIERGLKFGDSFDKVDIWFDSYELDLELIPSSIKVEDVSQAWGVEIDSPKILALLVFRVDLTKELGVVLYFNHRQELNGYERLIQGKSGVSLRAGMMEFGSDGFQMQNSSSSD